MQAKIIGGSAESEMPVVTTSPLAASPCPTVIKLHAPTNPRMADLKASGSCMWGGVWSMSHK
jgi:hypothetical protein